MKYLSATQIHNGKEWLPDNTIIVMDDDGTIHNIVTKSEVEDKPIEHFEGILCPGFVNAHCHIELSHMKGEIEEGNGLIPFLQSVVTRRGGFTDEKKQEAIKAAILEMKANGIVAVGDIANGTDTLQAKAEAGLHIHTFVEALGFSNEKLDERFQWPSDVYEKFKDQKPANPNYILRQSIVPHAPYSVSDGMFKKINEFEVNSIISIHNEETEAENEFYQSKTGSMFALYETLKIDPSFFTPSGKTSLQTYLPYLASSHPLILIHNTFMNEDDIHAIKERGSVFLCLCPNANWYIERKLPPVKLFRESGLPICLGTDSYSSNHQLNIWSEIKTLRNAFPDIPLNEMLVWATYNGAKALQMEDKIGTIEKGKKPGIVHINNAGAKIIKH